jgi:hypothetical protein
MAFPFAAQVGRLCVVAAHDPAIGPLAIGRRS